ncbi:MAG TPA: (deoxy)nucleoside triphosphate pyrophosphohydrolase [Verrucomicrobiae bacterium]|nr:(deoxy)nucleoside triphosphate pyrophosphohydrolase [Verrucomicrobiae bacterium]
MNGEDAQAAGRQTHNPKSQIRNYIEVSAGLVFRNGLLLITQRRPQDHLGGMWEFPGGKRQEGESDEECLRRELLEELAIEVEVGELIETVEHKYPEKAASVRLKFFRCKWKRHEPRTIGCADLAWVSREQLANYSFPAADAQLLQKLQSTPELWRS